MAHKTLIGGTAYEIKGGKTLIGGTGYDIAGGKTLVGGTGYDVSFGVRWNKYQAGYTDTYTEVTPSGKTDIRTFGNMPNNSVDSGYSFSVSTGYTSTGSVLVSMSGSQMKGKYFVSNTRVLQATTAPVALSGGGYQVNTKEVATATHSREWYPTSELLGQVIAPEGELPEDGILMNYTSVDDDFCVVRTTSDYRTYYYERV